MWWGQVVEPDCPLRSWLCRLSVLCKLTSISFSINRMGIITVSPWLGWVLRKQRPRQAFLHTSLTWGGAGEGVKQHRVGGEAG